MPQNVAPQSKNTKPWYSATIRFDAEQDMTRVPQRYPCFLLARRICGSSGEGSVTAGRTDARFLEQSHDLAPRSVSVSAVECHDTGSSACRHYRRLQTNATFPRNRPGASGGKPCRLNILFCGSNGFLTLKRTEVSV